MARTDLAVQEPVVAGLNATYSTWATGSGNGRKINPAAVLHVKNGTAGVATLTIDTPGTPGGNPIADKTVTVPATSDRFFDLSESVYRQSDGKVYVDCDVAVTGASIGGTD
jgi:hypothetical protein